MMLRIWLILPLLLLLGACSNFNALKKEQNISGTVPLLNKDVIEKIDLALELDPNAKGLSTEHEEGEYEEPTVNINESRKRLRKAFEEFYDNPINQIQRRNRVQERILVASEQRCGEYKKFLKQLDAGSNFSLGSAATLLAGMGAIFTPASTVRALSGSASIVSGIRSEMNADYFSNQSIQIITHAFEVKRRAQYKEMLKHRSLSMTDYPVEAAIKDAVTYHASCSLLTGLEEAASAVARIENPGLKGAQIALVAAKKLQHIMETEPKDIDSIELNPLLQSGDAFQSTASFLNDYYQSGIIPSYAMSKIIARVKHYATVFEKLKVELLEEPLVGKKSELDNMDQKLERVQKQTIQAIEDYRVDIEKDSAKIIKLRSDVIAEVDATKKHKRILNLRISLIEAEKNILFANGIYKQFVLDIQAMEDDLEEQSIIQDERITKASDQLDETAYAMVMKRIEYHKALADDNQSFMQSIAPYLNIIFGNNDNTKHVNYFKVDLLNKKFSEFKGNNNAQKLQALISISDKITDVLVAPS